MNRGASKNSTSKYKGVSWDESRGKWAAQISVDCKSKRLGRFKSEEEAAKTYNKAASELHGEYAFLNEVD